MQTSFRAAMELAPAIPRSVNHDSFCTFSSMYLGRRRL